MPSGKMHAWAGRVNLLAQTVVASGVILLINNTGATTDVAIPAGVGLVSGGVCGYIVTPDIDHPWVTEEEQRIRRWFGNTVLLIWRIIWLPFLLPGHRSRFTHSWPLGTILRMAWVGVLVLGIVGAVMLVTGDLVSRDWLQDYAVQIVVFLAFLFIGWSWQDLVHLWMDATFRIPKE